MRIINELARISTRNKRNSLAVRSSILIAVIMLGTLLFIYSELDLAEYKYHVEMFGDYHAKLTNITNEEYEHLQNHDLIKELELSQGILIEQTTFQRPNVDLYLKAPKLLNSDISGYLKLRLLEGEMPNKENEILVSETFMLENPSYNLGDLVQLGSKTYTISGIFKEQIMSFTSDYLFFGQLSSEERTLAFQGDGVVDATIWFKSERDTYIHMRQLLEELGKDETTLLKTGGLGYNTPYLEHRLIFAGGLIPSKTFVEKWGSRISLLVLLSGLFVVMIYNSFSVWNNQDLREISLLKSSGMTQRQVRLLVRKRALRLSFQPILWGLIISYGLTNLLFYLMHLTSKITQAHGPDTYTFSSVTPNPVIFCLLFVLANLCVLVAASRPARQSGKLSILEGIKGSQAKMGKIRARFEGPFPKKNIARSLAADNSVSYRRIFRGLALSMALAGMIFSTVLIVHSHRKLSERYHIDDLPYTLSTIFFTIQKLPKGLLAELQTVENADTVHAYAYWGFKYNPASNQDFFSPELDTVVESNQRRYPSNVVIYGLEDDDYELLLDKHGFNTQKEGVLILDKTAKNPKKAYKHRSYIPLTTGSTRHLLINDSKSDKQYKVPIVGKIQEFPFELSSLSEDEISLFTSLSKLEDFLHEEGKITENQPLSYRVKVAADLDALPQVTDELRSVIHKYIPSTDTWTTNQLIIEAQNKEQYLNELILTLGAQLLFVIIGLANAYNSVHSNLKARTRDFALLRSAGMTEKQLETMLYYEGFIVIRRMFIYYLALLVSGISLFAFRKTPIFSPIQLALNLNYPLLTLFFAISFAGVWLAILSGKRKVLNETIMSGLQQNY